MDKNNNQHGKKRYGNRDRKYCSRPVKKKGRFKNKRFFKSSKNVGKSTSAKKIPLENYPEGKFSGNRIFNIEKLKEVFEIHTRCALCGAHLKFNEISLRGVGGTYTIKCVKCIYEHKFFSSSFVPKTKNAYEVNRRITLGMRMVGIGHAGLQLFCGVMDFPPPAQLSTYKKIQDHMLKASETVAQESMQEAVAEEVELQKELQSNTANLDVSQDNDNSDHSDDCVSDSSDGSDESQNSEDDSSKSSNSDQENEPVNESDKDEPARVTVGGDGTWHRRGHTSLHGVICTTGPEGHKVLDAEVLTSYCKPCKEWESKNGKPEGPAWDEWYENHKANCSRNHYKSAGGMELEGMRRIFHRSVAKYNIMIVGYIGDGDSVTFPTLQKEMIYGPDIVIKKTECVGHVQKRVTYHMNQLKLSYKGKKLKDNKPLNGKGRLTVKIVKLIQCYYGNAIRSNCNSVDDMYNAIWAIWNHMGSSDKAPKHHLCPTGKESWCKYQKAKATKTLKSFKHSKSLPPAVMEAIKPIFDKLSDRNLLERCLGGKTQNTNESFNSIVWKFAPKTVWSGHKVIKIETYLAVARFNDGGRGLLCVMSQLGVVPGDFAVDAMKKLDRDRVNKLDIQAQNNTKEARVARKQLRYQMNSDLQELDENAYEAGGH